jgi:hypothetical protein
VRLLQMRHSSFAGKLFGHTFITGRRKENKMKRSERKKYVDKKLIVKLRVYAIIFLIMCAIGIYDLAMGNIEPLIFIGAVALGIALGFIIGRASNVVWHEETGRAIAKMDILGVIILLAYIVFAIFRRRIFGHWFAGQQLSAFVICFSAGIMLGRFLTLRKMIVRVLKRQAVY